MNQYKLLILSTVHLPQEYADNPTGWYHVARAPEGIFLTVPTTAEEEEQDFIQPIFREARLVEADYIWFDGDGEVINNLPVFDWE